MVKTEHFAYSFKRVFLAHLLIIAMLFAAWGISVLLNKIRKKPPLTIPVSFVIESAPQQVTHVEKVAPPPVKEATPAKTVYKKKEIQVSKKKIVRGEKKPEVQKKTITEEQLKKQLASDSAAPTYSLSDEQKNLVRIRNAFYKTWQQPSKAAVGDAQVTLQLEFDSSGNVTSRKLINSSGNKTLDDSVLAGAKLVSSVPGLTKEFLKRNKKVTVSFRVE
ncbi:MAG: TonB family protein [Kiritimatiellae bacterium]|jgi:TonB family protein|nr:TonB family protein [Kiritimatiellia bacterium]